jgi:hypothetical protein
LTEETIGLKYDSLQNLRNALSVSNLNEEIFRLKNLSDSVSVESPKILNYQINDKIRKINNNLKNIDKSGILNLLTQKELMLDSNGRSAFDFSEKISEIEKFKPQNDIKEPQKVISNDSGYFLSYLNGFENFVNFHEISENPSSFDFENLKKYETSNVFGKIIKPPIVIIFFKISNENSKKLISKDYINFKPELNKTKNFTGKVLGIFPKKNYFLLCVRAELEDDLLNFKNEKARIKINDYSGLKVNKLAIKQYRGQLGVFVKYHKTLHFKNVSILYEKGNYAVCKKEDLQNSLKVNDMVVTAGNDLYDKKRVV